MYLELSKLKVICIKITGIYRRRNSDRIKRYVDNKSYYTWY